MVGTCPKCGATVTSKYPFERANCPNCNPLTEVELSLAIIPGKRIQRAMEIVEKHSGIEAEQFFSELLHQTVEALVRGLKIGRKRKKHLVVKFV